MRQILRARERLCDDDLWAQMPLSTRDGLEPFRARLQRARAINAPLQGSAADIIRRAMVRMDEALRKEKLTAQMLLQVHDELVFEAPQSEVAATIEVVRKVMTTRRILHRTRVPLQVDAKAAQNWDEAH